MISKTKCRELLLAKRKALSPERRAAAALAIKEKLFLREGRILSFAPMGSEIDLKPLNEALIAENRLAIMPYKLDSLFSIPLTDIECILVPGLGFDEAGFRIGYGKGYYDRFLAETGKIHTIGIGFKEQLWEGSLPKDPWDIPVKELLLV